MASAPWADRSGRATSALPHARGTGVAPWRTVSAPASIGCAGSIVDGPRPWQGGRPSGVSLRTAGAAGSPCLRVPAGARRSRPATLLPGPGIEDPGHQEEDPGPRPALEGEPANEEGDEGQGSAHGSDPRAIRGGVSHGLHPATAEVCAGPPFGGHICPWPGRQHRPARGQPCRHLYHQRAPSPSRGPAPPRRPTPECQARNAGPLTSRRPCGPRAFPVGARMGRAGGIPDRPTVLQLRDGWEMPLAYELSDFARVKFVLAHEARSRRMPPRRPRGSSWPAEGLGRPWPHAGDRSLRRSTQPPTPDVALGWLRDAPVVIPSEGTSRRGGHRR